MSEVPPGVAWFHPLTPREAEVLELRAEGLSNDDISRRLNLNCDVIDFHVYMSRCKLDLWGTREELAEWVVKTRPPGSPPARMYRSGVVARSDFLNGLAQCPHCHLHLDAQKDVDEVIQPVEETRAIGARMRHRRCGASFEVVFGSDSTR